MAISPLENEAVLLAKIAVGDSRAFAELFDGYYNVLGEYVMGLVKEVSVAEEIVQEVFIKVWLKREELPLLSSFSNYLFILCRNKTYVHLRKLSRKVVVDRSLEDYFKQEAELELMDNPAEQYRLLIEKAVDKLPYQAHKVYVLSRHQRLRHEQIASQLGISPETVKKHIQYAVNFIKKDVQGQIDIGILLVLLSPLILN